MSDGILAAVISAGATLVAAIVGGVLAWRINRSADRRRQASDSEAETRRAESDTQAASRRRASKREAQILKAVQFLTGGTQKRSAGIGLLEGLLFETPLSPTLRSVFIPVVRNELIYLTTTSKSKGEFHELDNFSRLVTIWKRLKPDHSECTSLDRALQRRGEKDVKGLEFPEPYDADLADLKRYLTEVAAAPAADESEKTATIAKTGPDSH